MNVDCQINTPDFLPWLDYDTGHEEEAGLGWDDCQWAAGKQLRPYARSLTHDTHPPADGPDTNKLEEEKGFYLPHLF